MNTESIEPKCIDGCAHEWCAPIKVVGGCAENPGVFSNGGGVICTKVCNRCGVYRVTDTWAQDPETGAIIDGPVVSYREADGVSMDWVGWEHEDTLKEIQHRAWERWLDTEAAASLTALPTDGDMHTYHVSEEFVTPPEKQGQIVTCSYAYDPEAGVIIERTHDASDNTVRFDAYADPDDGSDWAPWSGTPSLGEYLGECTVIMEDVP